MYTKTVLVGDLQFGMYIKELDRPWVETPFAFQGFCLRTVQQLEALRRFCKHVVVDAALSEVKPRAPAPSARPSPSAQPKSSEAGFAIHGSAGYKAPADLAREIESAS